MVKILAQLNFVPSGLSDAVLKKETVLYPASRKVAQISIRNAKTSAESYS